VKGPMKILLGIVTSICGFIEVGSLSTSAQAGAEYRFRLVWAIVLATVCVAFLVEMSGRLAIMSKHPLTAAVREHFGVKLHAVPLVGEILLDVLVLAAEIGGICIALQLVTGVSFRWWAIPAGLAVWIFLWKGTFGMIENGVSLVGMLTLAFVVAAIRLDPPLGEIARGLVPSVPDEDPARYGFLAVSILGATISPYLLNFYSTGAVEEKWTEKDVGQNRAVAALGMGFGSCVSVGVVVVAALVLEPRGIRVDQYHQAALTLPPVFGHWGIPLFAAALFIGCFGAALEVGLNLSYAVSQALGWNWGEDLRPGDDARLTSVYTIAILLASLLMLAGVSPLELTMFSMALTVIVMPLIVFPFLAVMNDPRYLGKRRNGWFANVVVVLITLMGFLLALVSIPLELLGGG
jgi:Mn2+/Fe2+ NRAMP family transporter